jgi:hypothetical protein
VDIFVSVGSATTSEQEAFIRAIEDRLRSEGLNPRTLGRNVWSADAPLTAVIDLLDKSSGAVVIALERSFFPSGVEKRGGPKETQLTNVLLPTPWNNIEAAVGYAKGLPLLVIVERGLKSEGLLEPGYDWYVQSVEPNQSVLMTPEFNGVLASWKKKMIDRKEHIAKKASVHLGELTVGDLVSRMRPSQLWGVLASLAATIAAAFVAGAKLGGV